jgi:acetylxylan esterase
MVHTSFIQGLMALAAFSTSGLAASLVPVTNFGPNPNSVLMNIYVPDRVSASPPLIVAMHYCTGTAMAYYTNTKYAKLADQYGYIVLYPESPRSGKCWDVHSTQTLTHDAGGDSLGIASAVRWATTKYNVPKDKVFATGASSGAMMTNVMLGAYPDLFSAGSAFSGVAYGCFAGTSEWNSQCSSGMLVKSAQAWGDQVRAGYPGFSGKRPKMQEWHGTSDTTLAYANLAEENKEWSNVFGISFTRNETNNPLPNYTKMIYGDGSQYVAYSALNVGHTVPEQEAIVLDWFGITGSGSGGGASSSTTLHTSTATKPTSTSSAPATGATVAKWGQCGGIGYSGATTCASGSTCKVVNDYYSQCV